MSTTVNPQKVDELAAEFTRLKRVLENRERAIHREISQLIHSTNAKYDESYVRATTSEMESLLREIQTLSASITERLQDKSTVLKQAAHQFRIDEEQAKRRSRGVKMVSFKTKLGRALPSYFKIARRAVSTKNHQYKVINSILGKAKNKFTQLKMDDPFASLRNKVNQGPVTMKQVGSSIVNKGTDFVEAGKRNIEVSKELGNRLLNSFKETWNGALGKTVRYAIARELYYRNKGSLEESHSIEHRKVESYGGALGIKPGEIQQIVKEYPQNKKTGSEKDSINPFTKSLNSFKEIGTDFYDAQMTRWDHAFDSFYDFGNWFTYGLVDGVYSGLKDRGEKRKDSFYDYTNWLSMGAVETIDGAFFPEDPFSKEHWLNSIGVAGSAFGVGKLVTPTSPKPLTSSVVTSKSNSISEVTVDPIHVNPKTAKNIQNIVYENGYKLDEFIELLHPNRVLNNTEKKLVDSIRNQIGIPNEGTIMAKVIPQSDIYKYLYNSEYKGVRGFTAIKEDSINLKTLSDNVEGARLDYNNTQFKVTHGVDGISNSVGAPDKFYGVIEYKVNDSSKLSIPNWAPDPDSYPYTGRGFTGSKEVVLPEYYQATREFLDGDIIKVVDSKTGNIVTSLIFDGDINTWVLKK